MSIFLLYILIIIFSILVIYNLPLLLYGVSYETLSLLENDKLSTTATDLLKDLGIIEKSVGEFVYEVKLSCAIISMILVFFICLVFYFSIKKLQKFYLLRSRCYEDWKKQQPKNWQD